MTARVAARTAAAGLAAALLLTVPTAAASAAAAAPSPVWSLTGGAGPLSVVDRNDYDEQSGSPREVGRSLAFTVPGGGQRSEVRPRVPQPSEGTIQDVTYRSRLDRSFPADADGWQILLQWHQMSDEGSPPLAVEVNKGRLLLDNGENQQIEIGRVRAGDTVDLRLRVLFAKDSARSRVDLWNNGRQVLTGDRPPEGTLQDERNYMKVGLYRSESLDQDASLTLDALEVATGTVEAPPPVTGGGPRAPARPGVPSSTAAPVAGPAGSPDDDGGSWWVPAAVVLVLLGAGGAAVIAGRRRRGAGSGR